MTAPTALPIACARCASLLRRGESTCRVCHWDATNGDATCAPAVPTAQSSHPSAGPRSTEQVLLAAAVIRAADAGRTACVLAWLTCVAWALSYVTALFVGGPPPAESPTERLLSQGSAAQSSGSALGGIDVAAATAVIAALLVLVTTVAAAVWAARAREVCLARAVPPQRSSRTWTIAGWFVPFVSLVLPFRIVCDLWHGSTPRGPGRHPTAPAAVLGWWVAVLLAGLLLATARPGTDQVLPAVLLAAVLTSSVAAFLFVHIVTRVRDWQQSAAASGS